MPPAPAPSPPAAPAGRELCLRACAALLAAGYAADRFFVVLEGREYVVAAAPRAPEASGARSAASP